MPKQKPATLAECEALVYVCSCEGSVSLTQIGFDLAADGNPLWTLPSSRAQRYAAITFANKLCARLAQAHLIKIRKEHVSITEAGRIATALALIIYPDMRPAFFDEDKPENETKT